MTTIEIKSKIEELTNRLTDSKLTIAEWYEIDAEITYFKDELADAGEVVEAHRVIGVLRGIGVPVLSASHSSEEIGE